MTGAVPGPGDNEFLALLNNYRPRIPGRGDSPLFGP